MRRHLFLSAVLALVTLLIAACGSQAPAAGSHGGPVTDYVSLVDALRARDATVAPQGEVNQPSFSVKGQFIQVNGQDVQIFEYVDESAVAAQAEIVSLDGSSYGTSIIAWIESPHFYRTGRLIVLYVGDDAATMGLLKTILGPQFAGA